MDTIEQKLANWRASLMTSIPIGGLLSRNPIVYKWKAPFRCWVLREAALWRLTDLLSQSYVLHQQQHGLGARILLRSGLETLATLIYLNRNIQDVLTGKLGFHQFSKKTVQQVGGAKNQSGRPDAINVLTMIDKGDKQYSGLRNLYDSLSESAHPNFEGLVWGYSKVDHDSYETNFSNRWMDLYGESHLNSMELCMMLFNHEYNFEWPSLMNQLEAWIAANDALLEATKNERLSS